MKKTKSKILLSVGVISTLATTGSIVLSCGNSNPKPENPDQNKLNEITTEMVKDAITKALPQPPSPTIQVPDAPTLTGITINGLSDITITISSWIKDTAQGFVSILIKSIDKGTAHVDGAKFGTITISGFATDQDKLNGVTTKMVIDAITAKLAPTTFTPAPNVAPPLTEITINGLSGVTITVSNWQKDLLGSVLFSITSIFKGTAHIDGAKFGTIQIYGYKNTYTFAKLASMTADIVNCIIQTKEGKYYVATNKGLWDSPEGTTFTNVTGAGIQPDWEVKSIYQIPSETTHDGDIYVGTVGHGLWVLKNGGTFTQVSLGTGSTNWDIQTIYRTSIGDIYVGTKANGLWVLRVGADNFTIVMIDPLNPPLNILLIYQTLDGVIYVCTSNEPYKSTDGSGTAYTLWNVGPIYSMYQTSNGDIYAGGDDQLLRSKGKGAPFIQVQDFDTLQIDSIYQISNQDIFIGTDSKGLYGSNDDGATFNQISGGLSTDWAIQWIFQAPGADKLFICTEHGLWASN